MTACYAVYVQICDPYHRAPSGNSLLRHVYRSRIPITCQQTMRLLQTSKRARDNVNASQWAAGYHESSTGKRALGRSNP
jgi:hypothetical protein